MKPAIILVDIQKAFEDSSWGNRNNLEAELQAKRLIEVWRLAKWPIIHIQHTSSNPNSLFYKGSYGHAFKEGLEPIEDEVVFQKSVNSSFIGTSLKEYLDDKGIHELVIMGLTTQHCVSTTTRMAGNYGYDVKLVADATAAFETKGLNGKVFSAQEVHDLELALLNKEFATVINAEDVLKLYELV
ncbi:cysteine hydrolase family protein [Bacillus sp. 31A1R]|uniref:Cysteine hydrolase family protein n=1 Tax=Robertmurraya mangrovi TaxID=3098077 RepID=A0ABU5J2I6_9BACI|nr:cysteine hydrolase family protein [Bacillus sp. 31A1R]MDZ5473618.1 cysteine hydrolase family protein [Bacillus sp. 31A1R]